MKLTYNNVSLSFRKVLNKINKLVSEYFFQKTYGGVIKISSTDRIMFYWEGLKL